MKEGKKRGKGDSERREEEKKKEPMQKSRKEKDEGRNKTNEIVGGKRQGGKNEVTEEKVKNEKKCEGKNKGERMGDVAEPRRGKGRGRK